jgi:hypothetical protein
MSKLGPKTVKKQEDEENCIMKSIICTLHIILWEWSDQEGWDGQNVEQMGETKNA